MARKFISLLILVCITGCGVVRKKTTYSEERKIAVKAGNKDRVSPYESSREPDMEAADAPSAAMPLKAEQIISTAMTYSGVRYKFGGTTRKGMDCSGLLYVAFAEHDIPLPRISYQMAEEGKRIRITQVAKGDLLFFKTSRKGKNINHVGLVVAVEGDDIKFIHSTTSRGVIVSSLHEGFWNYAFVKATRIL